jgi:F-type H+-transporting ATPase subunit epsilon
LKGTKRAMQKKFKVEINTPERKFFEDYVESIIVETSCGYTEILADHMPIVIGMIPSVIKLTSDEKSFEIVNGEGFLLVNDNVVTVFCQSAEWPHEIEINKIKKEIAEQERRLNEAKNLVEYKLSKAALSRLFAKLKVK